MHAIKHVDGRVLWANVHLLFWLSLMPFAMAWSGESHFAPWPVAAWGTVQLMAGIAFNILVRVLIALHGGDSVLAAAVRRDVKGFLSIGLYALAVPIALVRPGWAIVLYGLVAIMWLVPDRRIERQLGH
jgi:uncharacterized membrane protein